MADEVKPALTAEGWEDEDLEPHLSSDERHALAAIALYGQPFGFTWEMVDDLREIAEALSHETEITPPPHPNLSDPWVVALTRIADRIAALLPPRQAAP